MSEVYSACIMIGVSHLAPIQGRMIFYMPTIYSPSLKRGEQCFLFLIPNGRNFHLILLVTMRSVSLCNNLTLQWFVSIDAIWLLLLRRLIVS